jgi:predicted Co/Zn/Cd cation transporter (cation efflux family)
MTMTRSTTMRTFRRILSSTVLAVAALAAFAVPASAQQLVDAGKQDDGSGALAFVLMTLLVALIMAALFFMDRVRRRREQANPAE